MNQKRGRDERLTCCWRWRRQWSLFPSHSVCLFLVVLSLVFSVVCLVVHHLRFLLFSIPSLSSSLSVLSCFLLCVLFILWPFVCVTPPVFFFMFVPLFFVSRPLFSGFFLLHPPCHGLSQRMTCLHALVTACIVGQLAGVR